MPAPGQELLCRRSTFRRERIGGGIEVMAESPPDPNAGLEGLLEQLASLADNSESVEAGPPPEASDQRLRPAVRRGKTNWRGKPDQQRRQAKRCSSPPPRKAWPPRTSPTARSKRCPAPADAPRHVDGPRRFAADCLPFPLTEKVLYTLKMQRLLSSRASRPSATTSTRSRNSASMGAPVGRRLHLLRARPFPWRTIPRASPRSRSRG